MIPGDTTDTTPWTKLAIQHFELFLELRYAGLRPAFSGNQSENEEYASRRVCVAILQHLEEELVFSKTL